MRQHATSYYNTPFLRLSLVDIGIIIIIISCLHTLQFQAWQNRTFHMRVINLIHLLYFDRLMYTILDRFIYGKPQLQMSVCGNDFLQLFLTIRGCGAGVVVVKI